MSFTVHFHIKTTLEAMAACCQIDDLKSARKLSLWGLCAGPGTVVLEIARAISDRKVTLERVKTALIGLISTIVLPILGLISPNHTIRFYNAMGMGADPFQNRNDAPNDVNNNTHEDAPLKTICAQFPDIDDSITILSQNDRFLNALSSFDRQVRTGKSVPASHEEYVAHYTAQLLPCASNEQERLRSYLNELSQLLNTHGIELPDNIQFIHTSCREELQGTLAYCRGNTIFFANLGKHLLAHELFHIYSSHHSDMRQKLYSLIGYQLCSPIPLPESLKDKRIVNPDSPDLDAYITINYQGRPTLAVPIDLYDLDYQGKGKSTFLHGIYHKFAVVERQENGEIGFKLDHQGDPILFDFEEAENLIEQIGQNTGYVDSPEEILADNFAIMLMGGHANSPEIIEKMKNCFRENAIKTPHLANTSY